MNARPTHSPGEVMIGLNRRDEPLMEAATRTTVRSPLELKQFLVPTDCSDCSKEALQYVMPLAQEHEAALTLFYVVPTAYGTGECGGIDGAKLEASMKTGCEKELARVAGDEVRDEFPADTLVRLGSPAREIVEVARSRPADLIVISTHGRTGAEARPARQRGGTCRATRALPGVRCAAAGAWNHRFMNDPA
jgi:nucleotide-binding universal stress UspA family protein